MIKALIYDDPVFIFGKDRKKIFLCCEALLSLLYPFKIVPTVERSKLYIPYVSLQES